MPKVTILFADNDPSFLKTRAEFLEIEGYRVVLAADPRAARRLLEQGGVDLAILDIRLLDDDDEKDTSGLTLAKDPAYQPVPKIILTDYPTYQAVREALGPVLDVLPPAVDFLVKREGPEAMIQAVELAIAAHVRVNRELEIHWDMQQQLSFIYLASLLQPDLPSKALPQRVGELEDLFRHLFYSYQQIRLTHLFWHDDRRFCLSVLARSPRAATDVRVVVCGQREVMQQETDLVRELAPETQQGVRLDGTAETVHFGAIAYALPDADLEAMRPLRSLFQHGRERPLKATFSHLLTEVLPAWHQHGRTVEAQGLMALYRQRVGLGDDDSVRQELGRRVDALVQIAVSLGVVGIERNNGSIVYGFPRQPLLECPDPVDVAYQSLGKYGAANLCWISPGKLSADNIVVDGTQWTWLTDFGQAGHRPQLWDFVCLEAMVRFDHSHAPDLLAWLEFEECLAGPTRLHERLRAQDVISRLKTSVVLIEQIRHQASKEAGPHLLPYAAGLLVWAVGAMARYDPEALYTRAEQMRGAHLLLAASLMARHLHELAHERERASVSSVASEAQSSDWALRLDEDGVQVWIGPKRAVDLTGQELELFLCLYEHVGKVVSRKILIERVFEQSYDPLDQYQEGSLNSLVRRLREKIEPFPSRPRYLYTVRGQGYRLETGSTTPSGDRSNSPI